MEKAHISQHNFAKMGNMKVGSINIIIREMLVCWCKKMKECDPIKKHMQQSYYERNPKLLLGILRGFCERCCGRIRNNVFDQQH